MTRKKIKNDTDQRPFSIIYHDFFKSSLLNTYEKMIFIALKIFSDNSNQCFPSLKRLSDVTGISKRKIQDALKEMEQKQIISIENRLGTDGGKSSNLYTLHDFKELWNINNAEQTIKTVDNEKLQLFELEKKKEYVIAKEKEPTSHAEQSNDASQKNNSILFDYNNTTKKVQSQYIERYTLNQIHQLFDYDIILANYPDQKQNIDSVMSILHTSMNTSKETIRISGMDMPAMAVIAKLMKLDKEMLIYAINKFSEQTERIKNPVAYMLAILYNTPEQYYLGMKNKENNEKAKADHSKETKTETKKFQNGFANLHQRDYDYEELERDLLNRAHI